MSFTSTLSELDQISPTTLDCFSFFVANPLATVLGATALSPGGHSPQSSRPQPSVLVATAVESSWPQLSSPRGRSPRVLVAAALSPGGRSPRVLVFSVPAWHIC